MMIPKVTVTFLFYSKFVTIALLFMVNSSSAWAKAPCIVDSNASNSCISEQSQGPKDKKKRLDSAALAIDQLYYSGGVLHNKASSEQSTPNQELEQPTDVDEKLALSESTSRNQNQGTSPESIRSEIREIFQKNDEVGRKSIQKCLRFGSYTSKIDGIWGQRTLKAISDFKNNANHMRQKDKPSLFSKIKNIFSRKAICRRLLDDTFG